MTEAEDGGAPRANGQGEGGKGEGAQSGGAALAPGLYVVSTPIGAARDITLRALDVLGAAEVLVAEDTRTLRHLMDMHGIALRGRSLVSYNDHNGAARRPKLMARLAEGRSLAYCSDAGTPLVADPGYRLVQEAAAAGHAVRAVPGPSAALAALAVAGLPSDRFLFAGFPPPAAGARARWIEEIAAVPATLILYETGRRIAALLTEMVAAGQGARPAAICRELTKRHEEVRRAPLGELARALEAEAAPRGEIVLVIGPPVDDAPDEETVEAALRAAMEELPLKAAAARVAGEMGVSKRSIYQMGLRLKSESDEE